MEAHEARDLIEEAIEETEARHEQAEAAERKLEKGFRERVSVLVGIFAVLLAIVHTLSASAQRDSLLKSIEASDTFAWMQAKEVRETVLIAAGNAPALDQEVRGTFMAQAVRLRQGDGRPGHSGLGINQMREKGNELRAESLAKAHAAEGYELGETLLQVAIVLLSIALVAQSERVVKGAGAMAGLGLLLALYTLVGGVLP
jgi:uncharacterized membrane protein YcjF (UPF0283 family)